jgi:hypothetical protein
MLQQQILLLEKILYYHVDQLLHTSNLILDLEIPKHKAKDNHNTIHSLCFSSFLFPFLYKQTMSDV